MDDWYHIDTVGRSRQVVQAGLDLAQTYVPYLYLRVFCIRPVVPISYMVYMETLETFVW